MAGTDPGARRCHQTRGHQQQVHALALADELGLATHPQHDDGESLCRLSDGKIRRYRGST